jgi:hypothetical protein
MSDISDRRQLVKALNDIKATGFQVKAAAILLSVNGLQNALEFVKKMGELNQASDAKDIAHGRQ